MLHLDSHVRFIREQEFRLHDDSAGDRHPLPLAARELTRPVIDTPSETNAFQGFQNILFAHRGRGAGEHHR